MKGEKLYLHFVLIVFIPDLKSISLQFQRVFPVRTNENCFETENLNLNSVMSFQYFSSILIN